MNTNRNGKTMFHVIVDGIDYGFLSARGRRELLARLAK